ATAPLDVVMLDAAGPVVEAVTVDGDPADFSTTPTELVVPLTSTLATGDTVEVAVTYTLEAKTDDTASFPPLGWYATDQGSYVLNEPDAARTWMPCNDHPSDKATFTFTLTVPSGLTAVANGSLTTHRTEGDHEVWEWEQDEPMATYLVQLLTGHYEIVETTTPSGLPLVSVALPADVDSLNTYLEVTPDQIAFFEQWFGPYPLDSYGLAITDSAGGLAMETQGRSLFSRDDLNGELGFIQQLLLAHELAHQWFGDAVTPAAWSDIWLNESFATYGQWMWFEHIGIASVQDSADAAIGFRPPGATGSPSADDLFSFNVYDGGAIVLHALRRTIGDEAFFTLLRRWAHDNDGQSRRTADFIALAEEVSGVQLDDFFATWLYAEVPPSTWP
ncbi:MAG TPA: M1 family metallopeptidase, partial [Ilumatobacteraceae bacterium]|nr:M1 family metallopeptidase [Ilumatobacteraceae bacterium]